MVKLSLVARQPEELVKLSIRSAGLLGAAVLAFGIAGVYNLPLRDYARYSMRGASANGGAPFEYATSWSMALYELPSVVFPNWVGFGGATYWGGMPFTDYPNAYLGVIVLLLALVGFAAPGGGDLAARIFAGALSLFALLVGLGKNFPRASPTRTSSPQPHAAAMAKPSWNSTSTMTGMRNLLNIGRWS